MLSKRIKLLITTIILCIVFILFYSEYRTMNFVNAFITDPNDFEELLDGVTIWEIGDLNNKTIAIVNRVDERLDELRLAFNSWQVRRTFKEINYGEDAYKFDFYCNGEKIKTFNIRVTQDGLMNINGREYELVSGTTVEELLRIVE